jgi:hypothetical protein
MHDEPIKTTVSHRLPIVLAIWIKEQAAKRKISQSLVVEEAVQRARAEAVTDDPQAA